MNVYRIRNWEKHFENSLTRQLKGLSWVPIANKYDGDGYTALMENENGYAVYGAWITMVGIASKCTPRGTLARSDGSPYTPNSLSRITRIPAKIYEMAIPILLEIGWLEAPAPVENEPSDPNLTRRRNTVGRGVQGGPHPASHDVGTEGKEGKEGKEPSRDSNNPDAGKPRRGGGNDITRLWDQLYESKHGGEKYPWSKKDAVAIATVAKTLGSPDALERAIGRYLADTDPFFTGHPIGKFQSQLARFTDAAAKGGAASAGEDKFAQQIADIKAGKGGAY